MSGRNGRGSTRQARRAVETAPPQNLDAEESVLGAMMLSPKAVDAVREELEAGDFYRASHGLIFRAICDLRDRGEPTEALFVVAELDRRGQLEEVGGQARLHELARLVPATANARHYARLVRETSVLRKLIVGGGNIARLGWEQPGEVAELIEQARMIVLELEQATMPASRRCLVEDWPTFRERAGERVPCLVEALWPEGAFGFIAGPPKAGKTWLGLALALSVVSGKRLFGRFEIPRARPVLYVALEGHRAALKARVGCLARGLGLDPDGPGLDRLAFAYKARGMNLADPSWAAELITRAEELEAGLVVVDVLRRAAVIRENIAEDFMGLVANLDRLPELGVASAFLHHFGKLSELNQERAPAERMSGSGAMRGALDVGVFITSSTDCGRRLRVEFEQRDLAAPDPIGVRLDGQGSGPNGGLTYYDEARIVCEDDVPEASRLKAPASEIAAYVRERGGVAAPGEILSRFDISDGTLRERRDELGRLGIRYAKKGNHGSYFDPAVHPYPQDPQSADADQLPLNHAGSPSVPAEPAIEGLRTRESAVLQGFYPSAEPVLPTGEAAAAAGFGSPDHGAGSA